MLKTATDDLKIENLSLQKTAAVQAKKITQLEAQNNRQLEAIEKYKATIAAWQEKYKLAMIRSFAAVADRYVQPNTPQQDSLFDEAELPEAAEPEVIETVEVAAHQKTKPRGKREALPEGLERVEIIHALPESELIGPNGEQYVEIGRDISEQLDIVPADVKVLRHIRLKYAVKGQEELGVKVAPITSGILPKSIAAPGLLAHVAESKYCHHLPLYRQEQIWNSLDVRMPRNTLCRWMMTVGEKVSPLVEMLFADMKLHGHMHIDESPVTVLEEKDKKPENASHQGYMWVYVNPLGVLYDYRSSREGRHPLKMMDDFKGYVQKDGYAGYAQLFTTSDRISVGCMAHVRRKFIDLQKLAGKKSKSAIADHVVNLIAKLYHIESMAKKDQLTETQLYEPRQEKAKLILDKLHQYLKEQNGKAPPQSQLGKAIQYALNQWPEVIRYIDHGMINIDNNPAERAIRPFAVSRKNWLFCGNTQGAVAAANLYSLIESAKLYDLKVFEYLKYIFTELPNADTPRKLEQLLPQYAQVHLPKIKKPKSK